MLIVRARVPEPLAQAARERAALPPGTPLATVVRAALARLAGWPPEAWLAVQGMGGLPEPRTCSRCKQRKPPAAFCRDHAKKDSLSSRCSTCVKTAVTEWVQAHPIEAAHRVAA